MQINPIATKKNISNDVQIRNFHFNNMLSFSGNKVPLIHLIDNGKHGKDLYYFAKALKPEMDIKRIDVDFIKENDSVKNMSCLKTKLAEINNLPTNESPEYIAIPTLCNIPLLNLSEQIKSVTKHVCTLTPENISDKSSTIINFLQIISINPEKYKKIIEYMDILNQGFENVFGVIKEINKAVQKGIRVYIPSGHPEHKSLTWLASEQGVKPELYHYISTGTDINNVISKMRKELKSKNWYDFNLLTLSDAISVNLQDLNNKNHLYSAYDSCVDEGARGVFNFTPIRSNQQVIGFSFTDEKSIQYPVKEYEKSEKLENLLKYVGLPIKQLLATDKEHLNFLNALKEDKIPDGINKKLFFVNTIFQEQEIKKNKLNLKGDFVDFSKTLFFKTNKENAVIFPNCDYEQSGRPSVVSMWGSCFSTLKAISRHINQNLNDFVTK